MSKTLSYQLDVFYLATKSDQESYKVQFTQKELKERLTPQEYHVTQEKGTERCVLCATFLMGGSRIKHILNAHSNARFMFSVLEKNEGRDLGIC